MERTEFCTRLFNQFKGMLSAHERNLSKEIIGRKSRTDTATYAKWLKEEHEKAATDPALVAYDRVLRVSMDTAEKAAEALTGLIHFDLDGVVNWQEQFEIALPLLTNWQPEKAATWKYRGNFMAYIDSSKADIRAKVFARFIEMPNTEIDIPGIVDRVLLSYPILEANRTSYIDILTIDYGKSLEILRALGQNHLESQIEKWIEGCKTLFLSWQNTTPENFPPGIIEGNKANAEMTLRLHEAMLDTLKTPAEELPALSPYFQNADSLDIALKAAFETKLLNYDGHWSHLGDKTKAVSVFWRACVTSGLAKADAPVYKVSNAMREQFSMNSLGQNAIDRKKEISEFGEEYKELYKQLLQIMRP